MTTGSDALTHAHTWLSLWQEHGGYEAGQRPWHSDNSIVEEFDDSTDSEFLRLARSVPEVQNFHQQRSLMDLVVDQYWGVHQSPNRRAFAGDGPHSGETLEQIDVIEQGGAETGRGFVIVFGDVADDVGKVV
jgi:hypothetical protein